MPGCRDLGLISDFDTSRAWNPDQEGISVSNSCPLAIFGWLGKRRGSTRYHVEIGVILLGPDATCKPRRCCCLSPAAPGACLPSEALGRSARIEVHPRGYRGCGPGSFTGPAPEAPHVGRVPTAAALDSRNTAAQGYRRAAASRRRGAPLNRRDRRDAG